jgi:hypothetical protein
MKGYGFTLLVLAAILLGGAAAGAQAPAPGGMTAMQGFSSPALIAQLSLYLPPESTKGMFGAFGGRGGTPGGGGQGAGGQGAQSRAGGAAGGFLSQLAFTRDPKLYLTKDQIGRLLPILIALRENPMPTPSRAKQVQADVDGILTPGQKAEYEQFRKAVQDLIQRFRQQAGASGGEGSGGQGDAGQQRAVQGPGGQGQGGAQMTPLQRRQRQLDAFIKVLQERQQQVGA